MGRDMLRGVCPKGICYGYVKRGMSKGNMSLVCNGCMFKGYIQGLYQREKIKGSLFVPHCKIGEVRGVSKRTKYKEIRFVF